MISSKVLAQIKETLSSHEKFIFEDFTIDVNKGELIIRYNYYDDYHLTTKIPSSKTIISEDNKDLKSLIISPFIKEAYVFSGRMRPGEISDIETFVLVGIDNFYKKVNEWVQNLEEEMYAKPIQRELKKHYEAIKILFEKVQNIDNELFNKKDAERMSEKLDEMYNSFALEIEKLSKDKEEIQSIIDKMKSDIIFLKENMNILDKRGWVKAFLTRVSLWSDSKQQQQILNHSLKMISSFQESVSNE